MAETVKKAAAKAKEVQEALSSAVSAARTRKGEPKVIKAAKPAPEPVPDAKPPTELLAAFITEETAHMHAVAFPDDTGDYLFNAIEAYLYHRERIAKAELVLKHLKEG